jgi:glycerophosphoryl diester phosphodiesterase
LVIAHRGASAYEFENSLAAFRLARLQGADGVELDVHVTADGVPVVHHDPTVDGSAISEMSSSHLAAQRLPNGEPPPALADVLTELGEGVLAFVEVKDLPADRDAELLAVLDQGPAPLNYHLHSFDHRIVRRLKDQRPRPSCGVLSCSYPVHPFASLEAAGAGILWQQETLVDAELTEAAHGRGYRVFAWTVDDPERMRLLIDAGVDAVCTNRPDVARKVVG